MKLTGKVVNDGLRSVSEQVYASGQHKIPRVWVVVADAHNVRLFSKPGGRLEEIGTAGPTRHERLGGVPNRSLGRVASSASGYVRHRLEPRAAPGEEDARSFAHDIAVWLDGAAQENSFDRLVLAAAPHMLGELRKVLSKSVHARVVAEVNKDLTKMNKRELYAELEKIVWF